MTDHTSAARVTLDQWRALRAVVDAGSYARAAQQLHKSQSALTYAIQRQEQSLDVKVFQLHGRKAALTDAGTLLYRRAGVLLQEAASLEMAAGRLAQGNESEIRLAVDIVFPTWLLLDCLGRFAAIQPETRIDLFETVLGGSEQALTDDKVDLAIVPIIPAGFLADALMHLRFLAVAAPDHPLHRLGRPLSASDLRRHRQLVMRDSDPQRQHDFGWLGSEQRWTVSHKATAIRAVCLGHGFAWYPDTMIHNELASGALKPLPLQHGSERHGELYLVFRNRDLAGPGVQLLAQLLRDASQEATSGRVIDRA